MVFIHGFCLDHLMWQSQISKLNEFSIITYDLLGHGKTPCKKEKLTLNDFSKQLDEILNNLQVDKMNLIGLSLGPLIALAFTSNYQDKVNNLI